VRQTETARPRKQFPRPNTPTLLRAAHAGGAVQEETYGKNPMYDYGGRFGRIFTTADDATQKTRDEVMKELTETEMMLR